MKTSRISSLLRFAIAGFFVFSTCASVTAHAQTAASQQVNATFVGYQRTTLATAESEKIEVALWYPTATPSREHTFGPYTFVAALDAPVNAGKHPLILISHGTGGNNMNQHELAAAFAQSGYIAVALTHPGDNYRDRALVGTPKYFSERPRQVSRVLDALLADTAWSARIDSARIGFFGHSAGGFTGAALVGATPSIANTVKHCAANYDADPWFCAVSGSKEKAIANAQHADYIPAVPPSTDPRIRAAVLAAPVGAFFTPEALKNVKVPVHVWVAGRDTVLVPRFHAAYVGSTIPGATVTTTPDGGHFMLLSKIKLTDAAVNGANVNDDPPGFDRAAAIRAASKALPAWFDQALAK